MNAATRLSTRKPHGYLGAAVRGHSCPAIATGSFDLNQADRPKEAGS